VETAGQGGWVFPVSFAAGSLCQLAESPWRGLKRPQNAGRRILCKRAGNRRRLHLARLAEDYLLRIGLTCNPADPVHSDSPPCRKIPQAGDSRQQDRAPRVLLAGIESAVFFNILLGEPRSTPIYCAKALTILNLALQSFILFNIYWALGGGG